jgi:predicted RNase H-like HicB family nuclease
MKKSPSTSSGRTVKTLYHRNIYSNNYFKNQRLKEVVMSQYQFTVIIEPDEDAFHAYVPALPGCHTFGATVEEARTNIAEAIALHIESMLEANEFIPIEHEPLFITRLSIPVAA